MIEEVTPQLLTGTMLLVCVVVPVLAALLSALLIYRYRIAVERAMGAVVGYVQPTANPLPSVQRSDGSRHPESLSDAHGQLAGRLLRGPWSDVARCLGGALGFALVFVVAAHVVYPHRLGLAGSMIALWIYLWPFFVAAPLIVPRRVMFWVSWYLLYLAAFAALGSWAGSVLDVPGYRFGAVEIPARSSATPESLAKLWLMLNAAPTLLVLIALNRHLRAVAPLVLALVTAAVVGVLTVYFLVFSARGSEVVVAMAVSSEVHVHWILLVILLATLGVFGALGWLIMRWIAAAYQRQRLSDQSLLLGSMWSVFGSVYTMWLVFGGTVWILTLPVALLAFQTGVWLTRRGTVASDGPCPQLVFLRVFSLGSRSESLFDAVARHWRHIGSVQLITGPDLARSTVQPHQFLDFLAGRLRRHFVSDDASLQRSLTERDRDADPDHRYRVNSFFCHSDSWKVVLPRLVGTGDVVLMDLRSFSRSHAGCRHELEFIVAHLSYSRCLLLVDQATDEAFIDEVIVCCQRDLPDDSPNRGRPASELQRYCIRSVQLSLPALLHRLCTAGVGPEKNAKNR